MIRIRIIAVIINFFVWDETLIPFLVEDSFDTIFGIAYIKNTAVKDGIINQTGKRCSGLVKGTIDIKVKNTKQDIKSGSKFFGNFFMLSKVNAITGKIIMKKKWMFGSPNKNNKNTDNEKVVDRTIMLILSNLNFIK